MADVLIPKLPREHFDLSKKRVGSMQSGLLYPIYSKIAQPGETLRINTKTVIRRLPTKAPSFAEDKLIIRWFKVPIRTLWGDWKSWLTGVKEYSDDIPYEGDVPRWIPSDISKTSPKSLWAILGYPVNTLPTTCPADFKRQAYGWIRDIYFRYRPVQETALDEGKPGTWKGEDMFRVNKDRDYFTTGLTQQQVGEAVSLPITGDTTAIWDTDLITASTQVSLVAQDTNNDYQYISTKNTLVLTPTTPTSPGELISGITTNSGTNLKNNTRLYAGNDKDNNPTVHDHFIPSTELNKNTVELNNVSSATIAMIRHAFARQVQGENLARIGAFYPDVMRLNWGTAPSDDILGYPIYIGGYKINVINSEVLQTAPSDTLTPLGDMAGHGLGVGQTGEIEINTTEHCVIMAIAYFKSENFYGAQQLKKEDMFISNDDVGWIAYQHVSEQPVKKQELCCMSSKYAWINEQGVKAWGNADPTAAEYNEDTLFYMPMYQFMREDYNDVFGLMVKEQLYTTANGGDIKEIDNLYYWTKAQFYSIKDGERVAFNDDFIDYKEDMRDYAVQYIDENNKVNEDQYIVWFNFIIDSYQVLDKDGTPGQLDHLGVIA